MAGAINDFKSSFKGDLARPNRFKVIIKLPQIVVDPTNNNVTFTNNSIDILDLMAKKLPESDLVMFIFMMHLLLMKMALLENKQK